MGKKKKLKNKHKGKFKYPFIIHAAALTSEESPFPTHTHGLYEIGMPEMLIDPLAFGPEGNGGRINSFYKYFMTSEGSKKLKEILSGETIKLTLKDIRPNGDDPYVYCFREVTSEFEGVKISYDTGDGIPEDMRFIQIYVEGDDFALKDEYYKNGVRW